MQPKISCRTLVRAICLVASLLPATASAGVIGPNNYDFARFKRPTAPWTHVAHYGGWTPRQADVNGDGRVDLILTVLDGTTWRTWTALSNGDGTFATPVNSTEAATGVGWTLEMIDVNGDGRTDMLLHASDGVSWRSKVSLAAANGTFTAPVSWQNLADYGGWTPGLGDFNGDGLIDMIMQATDGFSWRAWIAIGAGNGTFATPVLWQVAGNHAGWRVGLGDFNGDGRTDLSLDFNDASNWRSWVALASGSSFAAPTQWVAPGQFAGLTPARGDFNADGRMDLQLWSYDAGFWRSWVALSNGVGGFSPTPIAWSKPAFGAGWTFALADVNGDGGADMVAQRAGAKGWEARVAVASGGGAFFTPKGWGKLDDSFAGMSTAIVDITGDGRADVLAHSADAAGWRAWTGRAQGCDHLIGNDENVNARIAALQNPALEQVVCFKPGVYTTGFKLDDKHRFAFVAAHGDGDVEIRASVKAYLPGTNPGGAGTSESVVQIIQSTLIEFDGFKIRNTYVFAVGGYDEVSRAVEVFGSHYVTLSNSHLIGQGKQVLYPAGATNLLVAGTQIDCYYFCVAADDSTVVARGSTFTAAHADPGDGHSMFWTFRSNHKYVDSTLKFTTGKSLFSGCNMQALHLLEVEGDTTVSPTNNAGWLAQHQAYDGLNLNVKGTFPPLAPWDLDMGQPTYSRFSKVCFYPAGGTASCVDDIDLTRLSGCPW